MINATGVSALCGEAPKRDREGNMKKFFRNGSIVLVGKYHEEALYDVSSNGLCVTFDGRGGIANLIACNHSDGYVRRCFLNLFVDGKRLDPFCEKRVKLVGRCQKLLLKDGDVKISVFQFVPANENAVFYEITANKAGQYDFVLDFGQATEGFRYAAGAAAHRYVPENAAVYLRTSKTARLVFAYDTEETYCEKLLSRFAAYKAQVVDEYEKIVIPRTAKTEKEKALYLSSVLCALENYKEYGENFKGFVAGVDRVNPIRTYFRDSYWTALCLYGRRPDLIKNQIVTLSHGIEENGDCSSAVTCRLHPFWRNHFDSPSYYVLTVYDYINRTGDFSILDVTVNGKTVYQLCLLVLDKLSGYEDETGLVVKSGQYNKRDWADEVNRTGYVTYVELLYARALWCLSRIALTRDKTRADRYHKMFVRTKNAINTLLWDDEKGYYINYKNDDFVEDNLSIDTILAVLFGIADETKTERLLDAVSALLETRNNKVQKAGDFGVMCVWPFYRGIDRFLNRSSQVYDYHNGAVWPYWSALVAYAQKMHGRDCTYALTSSFDWGIRHGHYTPINYYSPINPVGSPLHAWNSVAALVYDWEKGDFFKENGAVWTK